MPKSFEKRGEREDGARFEESIGKGIHDALELIKRKFESGDDERENMPFHNSHHTKDVIRRTYSILSAIQKANPELITEHEILLGKMAAVYHDVVQNWKENKINEGGFAKILRQRFTKRNELDSAELAVEFMNDANAEGNGEIFMAEDENIVREAIKATIPDYDPRTNTVIQPKLDKDSLVVERAVALADLGTAGMDGAVAFCKEGDALFREENLDILDSAKKSDELSDAQKDYYRKRMLAWSEFQPLFAEGRKTLLNSELEGLPEESREAVKLSFDKFDESTKAAKDRATRREKMTFEELLADMGYSVRK